MSKSKILLINFTEEEKRHMSEMPIDFDRGYLSDFGDVVIKDRSFGKVGSVGIKYYFPHSIFEYKTIIINLDESKKFEKEFETNLKPISFQPTPTEKKKDYINFIENFTKYRAEEKGILITLLGNHTPQIFSLFGLEGIIAENVQDSDITCECMLGDETSLRRFLKEIKAEVKMPTTKYLRINPQEIEKIESYYVMSIISRRSTNFVYWSLGDKILASFLNIYNQSDWSKFSDFDETKTKIDKPSVFILPQFKNNISIIKRLLKELAKIYPLSLPEIYEPDWKDTDKYYPKEIKSFDDESEKIKKEAVEKIDKLREAIVKIKQKYEFLRSILYSTGDELKESVIKVLKEIFKLDVIDVDKTNSNKELAEDILIKFKERQILAEVKGVKQKNPSPLFIGQVWKHIALCKNREISEGALILNHDSNTDPAERPLAYTGDHEEALKDIIFINTRALFDLAIAIIDHEFSVTEAQEILLQKGRVAFDIRNWLKKKEVNKNE